MNPLLLKKFNDWWISRKHTRTKLKGLQLSDSTLDCYTTILGKIPDIEINESTDIDATILFIRQWLSDNCGEGKTFETKYPQLIFAIRTYIKMYESDPNPKINRIAREIRKEIKPPVYQDIKGTQKLFKGKFLSKEQIRTIINSLKKDMPYGISVDKAKLFFQLLYDTGCRIAEESNIRKKDVDFASREISVIGKGKYERKVKYEVSTQKILETWCNNLSEEDLIFNLNVVTLKQYFKAIIKYTFKDTKSKMWNELSNKVSPHWFRHSRATHLAIVWTGDMIRLKDYMGWSDIKMAEVYVSNRTLLSSKIQNYKSTDLWED